MSALLTYIWLKTETGLQRSSPRQAHQTGARPMNTTDTPIRTLHDIEIEARRLRAQAFRDLFVSLRGAIASLFVSKGHGARA